MLVHFDPPRICLHDGGIDLFSPHGSVLPVFSVREVLIYWFPGPQIPRDTGCLQFPVNDYLALFVTLLMRRVSYLTLILLVCLCPCWLSVEILERKRLCNSRFLA